MQLERQNQDFIGKVIVEKSYKLKNVMVKCFGDRCSLFTPKEDCSISDIEDMRDVAPLQKSIKRTREITNARVIAVSEFASNFLCISCNKGCIKPIKENQSYGRCAQCRTTLLLSSCKVQIFALLTLYSNGLQVKLSAVDDKLAIIAGVPLKEVTDIALLMASPFNAVYNSNVIVEVSR